MNSISKKIDSYMLALILEIFIIVSIMLIPQNADNSTLNFLMLGITFLISITSYIGGLVIGLIVTSITIFLYASYIFYNNTILNMNITYISYLWMISMPIICLTSGKLSSNIILLQENNKDLQEKYKHLVTVDETTGLGNVRHFYNTLDKEMKKSRRHKNKLTLMMIKLPYYKDIKKIIGDSKTETLMKSISDIIIGCTRGEDERYYIDEDMLGIIMPHTDFSGANVVKERIKSKIEELNLEINQGKYYVDIDTKVANLEMKDNIKDAIEFKTLCEEELQYDV
ncbi:GGDEF domain-containing protein [Paraclostridium bifermentans]|uniref:GGDEF domain-containing protein n=1 Tax=Paraclostridium bifermentans TaxID=1490 RepID=UPI00359C1076